MKLIILILIKKNLTILKFVNIINVNLITHNDRYIILYEICDKEKLKYILENNNFNEEVNNLARNYYDSLDNDGFKRIVYRQTCDKNRYYGDSFCLTYLKKKLGIA